MLRPIGAEVVVAGEDFRFGTRRQGDLALLRSLGFDVADGAAARGRLVDADPRAPARRRRRGARRAARPARRRSRARSSRATQRGGTLGFPTANLDVRPELLVPANGIYAGAALGHRAAISIGTNPHYGGSERRVEAFLLDFAGDLYGQRLVVELWQRLRDEQAFESENELVAADRAATWSWRRHAERPA